MSNEFRGTGNLGDHPILKTAMVRGEERRVAEMRVFFDEYKPDGKGGFEPNGGFWMSVSLWDQRGEQAAAILRKGARVHVVGRLVEQEWTDKEGIQRTSIQLSAESVYLSLSRVEEVKFRARRESAADTAEAA